MEQWIDAKTIKQTKQIEEVVDIDQLDNEISSMEQWIKEYKQISDAKLAEQQLKLDEMKKKRANFIAIPNRPKKVEIMNNSIVKEEVV